MKKCIRVLCMLLVAGCMVQAADPLGYGLVYDPTRVDSVNYMLGLETDGYDPSDFQMNSGQEWVPLPIPTDSPFHPSNSAVGSISAPSQDKGDDGGPAEYFGDDCDNSMEMEPQQDDDGKGEEEEDDDDDATQIQIVADQAQLQQVVKRYNCSFCIYATDHTGHFNRHMRKHTGEKPYRCQYEGCDKAFANSSNLKSHERTHRGERLFKCDFKDCDKEFFKKRWFKSASKNTYR